MYGMKETWRPVLNFEDTYEVSSHGNVRRKAGSDHCPIARPRKLVPRGKYFQVILSRDNKVTLKWVHRLVAEAFIGAPTRDAYFVNHKDGDGKNNLVANLEWVSHAGNCQHAYDTGLRVAAPSLGSKNAWAKLTEDDAMAIRRRYRAGERPSKLAREYGITRQVVWKIHTGKAWAHAK